MQKDLMFKEFINNHVEFANYVLKHWLEKELLTPQWWFLLIIVVVLWAVWWKLIDKKRIETILLYGLLWAIVATIHNTYLGLILVFWVYPINLSPSSTLLNPINFTVLPVIFMLIFQFFSTWKSFFIATVAFASFSAFVAEPLFVHYNMYILLNWIHLYSFVLYIMIAMSLRWLVLKVKTIKELPIPTSK